jgi:hypothetical protein
VELYGVGEVVDALVEFCHSHELQPRHTYYYFWICCFCVNQHRVVEAQKKPGMLVISDDLRSLEEETTTINFQKEFADRVISIGKIVCLLKPWYEPKYLKRISWCIYVIFMAQKSSCEVMIVMPPQETKSMTLWN